MYSVSEIMPSLFNQTDRIQGMARYMNTDGASGEGFTLVMIAVGMAMVVILLKLYAGHKEKQRHEQAKEAMKRRQNAEKRRQANERRPAVSRRR